MLPGTKVNRLVGYWPKNAITIIKFHSSDGYNCQLTPRKHLSLSCSDVFLIHDGHEFKNVQIIIIYIYILRMIIWLNAKLHT